MMKKRIIKGIGAAAVLAALVGCNEINFSGLLNISEPITFANQSRAVVTLAPGQYNTKATIGQSGSQKQITLEINNGNQPTKVQISFDKNISIGENFDLTAAQIGQNFDVRGTMKTSVTNSPDQSGWESCTYQRPQTVCRGPEKSAQDKADEASLDSNAAALTQTDLPAGRAVPEASNPVMADRPGPHPGPMPGPVPPPHTPTCSTIWVTQYGNQNVTYHYQTTTRDLNASFVQGAKTLGTYTGQSSDTQKIYTFQGQCY